MDILSVDAAANTNPSSNVAIINRDKLNKQPYDVEVKNYNPNPMVNPKPKP